MNKKAIKHAFNTVIKSAEKDKCDSLHHKKHQYHEHDEVCPVEYDLGRQIHVLREFMKSQGI